MICKNYLFIRIKMEYFLLLCEIVRNQSPQHRQDRIVSIRLKNFLTNNSENLKKLNDKNNICKNIGLSITKFKNKLSDFSDWTFLLNDVSISCNNVCMGKYLDCKHDEICSTDLNVLFSKIQTNNTPVILSRHSPTTPIVKYVESKSINSNIIIETKNTFSNSNATSKPVSSGNDFKTAHEELIVQKQKSGQTNQRHQRLFSYGTTRRSVGAKYKQPQLLNDRKEEEQVSDNIESVHDDRLRNIDENMIKLICNEIMHKFKPITWEDIAGLEYAKSSIQEAVVWPILRPDIFTGLRRPPRGILLFGPPGTGKTLIGKCIASQSKSTFFSISASSLTSKWIGEGEKMVRALFAVATVKQPSVIFIDEIDSLLCQRTETEHESSRRIKTEFLVQLDGAGTRDNERLLIVGATNRPQELDEAARRRFVRRLYIPLPEFEARIQILKNLLSTERTEVTESEFIQIGHMSEGYSAADMESLCREASMEPIRSIPARDIPVFNEKNVRSVNYKDFLTAFKRVRTSVSPNELQQYEKWNNTFGANNSK